MKNALGIRREDKNPFERRAALTPRAVLQLCRQHGLHITLQPSGLRIFSDSEYQAAGATISEDLSGCQVILGIKEVPPDALLPGRAYLFFSHTIKGQQHNMPMLRRLMELGCTLIDHERITDDQGRRLVFFGRFAGLAGAIDTLWALGQRLASEGMETPLARLQQAHQYRSLAEARHKVQLVGQALHAQGLSDGLRPLVFAVTGYGNVSQGAQEILDLLGVQELSPQELLQCPGHEAGPVVKAVFKEHDLVKPRDGAFDLQDYYQRPEGYSPVFSRYLDRIHVLVNCIYWDERYPRLVTIEDLRRLYSPDAPRPALRVIGDISCDVCGSIEATVRSTEPDSPVFVYDVSRGQAVDGVAGGGPVIMAVDNLPAELPTEASAHFSEALMPFVPALAAADLSAPLEQSALPAPIRQAVIVHQGQLTAPYAYLAAHLGASGRIQDAENLKP